MSVDLDALFDGAELSKRFIKLEDIPNASYQFEIDKAHFGATEKSGDPIVRLAIRIISEGNMKNCAIDHSYLIGNPVPMSIFKTDLTTLGINIDVLKGKFSTMIQPTLDRLIGLRFTGTKVSSDRKDGKPGQYHNLRIIALAGAPTPNGNGKPPQQNGNALQPQGTNTAQDDDTIPF